MEGEGFGGQLVLNKITIPDEFPISFADELLGEIGKPIVILSWTSNQVNTKSECKRKILRI